MARYQFRNLDGSKPTETELTGLVPALIPFVKVDKPVYPLYGEQTYEATLRPDMTNEERITYRQIWDNYTLALRAYNIAYNTAKNNYLKQFTDFELVIASRFVFYTGTYNRTTWSWSWSLLPDVKYDMKRAATLLITKHQADYVNFILNSYFGW
jgi:hypothetical protein